MKELKYEELKNMIGKKVLVRDDEYDDIDNQIATVFEYEYLDVCPICNDIKKYMMIEIRNNEFEFEYDKDGNCEGGKFTVFELEQ